MKTLLSTTAVVIALGLPGLSLAQTATSTMPLQGFLIARGQSDLFASELMGHDVYARRAAIDMTASAGQITQNPDGTRSLMLLPRADLDGLDAIGQVNEIILSSDGQVRALVIGVGGFLGMGERDAAVTMDQVTFATDPDDHTQMYIIVNTAEAMLRESPPYMRSVAPMQTQTAFTAPDHAREGFTRVSATEVSTALLIGKNVYGLNENSVGTVEELLINSASEVTHAIIDFGGFLGMGSTQISVGFEELTILSNAAQTELRVYIDATREQVQARPEYRAVN